MPASPSRDPIVYSPTTASFLSSTSNHVTTGAVRRNLFSTHLSRRPATGSQPPPQLDGHSDQHESHSRLRSHQRSASTPSLSPSPPRLSPFHTTSEGTFLPPPVPQLSPPHRTAWRDGYDPTVSPNKPLSPHSSAALFPNQSIIALDPLTGRPVLPKLPALPGKLKLTDSDEDEMEDGQDAEDEEDELDLHDPQAGQGQDWSDDELQDPAVQAYMRQTGHPPTTRQNPYGHDHNHTQSPPVPTKSHTRTDHSQATAIAAAQRAQAQAEALDEADSERRDRERIERLLRDMMDRQRARASAKGKSTSSSKARHDKDDDDDEEAQEEKEELMGLIMGSLRREVARADEESWMFGEAPNLGAMVGRDDVGVYD